MSQLFCFSLKIEWNKLPGSIRTLFGGNPHLISFESFHYPASIERGYGSTSLSYSNESPRIVSLEISNAS